MSVISPQTRVIKEYSRFHFWKRIPLLHPHFNHPLLLTLFCCAYFILSLPTPSNAQTTSDSATARLSLLQSFPPPNQPEALRIPYAPLLWMSDTLTLCGAASAGPGASPRGGVFSLSASSGSSEILHEFAPTEVRSPSHGLTEGPDGFLYGTAAAGGASSGAFGGIFRIRPDGTDFQQIHVFRGDLQGAAPSSPVTHGPGGFLYGLTDRGGANNSGTFYRLTTQGTQFEVLHSFRPNQGEPAKPGQALLAGPNDTFFGISFSGGTQNAGTLFRIQSDGSNLQVLHHFQSLDKDGRNPSGSLLGWNGWLLGVTSLGGTQNAGTLYRIRSDGTDYQILRNFGSDFNGLNAYGHLTEGLDGMVYGVTLNGGSGGVGTIYRLNPTTLQSDTIFEFQRLREHPQLPQAGLVLGDEGALYGTSSGGGQFGFGTVYRIQPPASIRASVQGNDWILEWVTNGLDYRAELSASAAPESPDVWQPLPQSAEQDGILRRIRIPAPSTTSFIRLHTLDP